MSSEISLLAVTAASIGFLHTLLGPDHYLPFIVIARSGKWSLKKTMGLTFLCGLGHILSSVVIGLVGIALGIAVHRVTLVESIRGNLAAWFLIAFGLAYLVWGLNRAYRNRPHQHLHTHAGADAHQHTHVHDQDHLHVHDQPPKPTNLTPWILFTIFIFGPCEPLIPILMYPAAQKSLHGLILVTAIFGSVTILTMLGLVTLATLGMNLIPLSRLERYTHALAGATILLCGLAIQFLGL